jgi:hypothetical protein
MNVKRILTGLAGLVPAARLAGGLTCSALAQIIAPVAAAQHHPIVAIPSVMS